MLARGTPYLRAGQRLTSQPSGPCGTRTHTLYGRRILNPLRLPIPPRGRGYQNTPETLHFAGNTQILRTRSRVPICPPASTRVHRLAQALRKRLAGDASATIGTGGGHRVCSV